MTQKATHRGYLKLGQNQDKVEIPCAILENELRIISHTGIYQAFKRPRKAEKKNSELPSIISARNLHPFVTEEVREACAPVHYFHTNGTVALGYRATFLPLLCNLFLKAEKKGKLLASQNKFAARAKILLQAIPRKGVAGLIDEVTGFELEQELLAIETLLKSLISGQLLEWQRQFPRAFYQEIFRLHKWPYKPSALKKNETVVFGQFLKVYVYQQLPADILRKLEKEGPKMPSPIRPKKNEEAKLPYIEEPNLDQHLTRLMTVMELSDNLADFKRNFERVFKKIYQMTMF